MASCAAVPLSASAPAGEVARLLRAAGGSACIALATDASALQKAGLSVLVLVPDVCVAGAFTLQRAAAVGSADTAVPHTLGPPPALNAGGDTAMVLFTSGSTGARKAASYSVRTLAVAATCVASSWALGPGTTAVVVMPLHHVGGVVRSVLAPLSCGGRVMVAGGLFDPGATLAAIATVALARPWFYAGPPMHAALVAAVARGGAAAKAAAGSVWLVANASGPLPLAVEDGLRAAFPAADVLPSYGSTECMPISSPAVGGRRGAAAPAPRGSSGVACGPHLAALHPTTHEVLPPGCTGLLAVRGPPMFDGYLSDTGVGGGLPSLPLLPGGWLDTGDLGHLDAAGFVFVTGRAKEVINRGGETLAPADVEGALCGLTAPDPTTGALSPLFEGVLAFAAPHEELGDGVCCAVVLASDATPPPRYTTLCAALSTAALSPSKWPHTVVVVRSLPRSAAGKLVRVGQDTPAWLCWPLFAHDSIVYTKTSDTASTPGARRPGGAPRPAAAV